MHGSGTISGIALAALAHASVCVCVRVRARVCLLQVKFPKAGTDLYDTWNTGMPRSSLIVILSMNVI